MSAQPTAASRAEDLARIRAALFAAAAIVRDLEPDRIGVAYKAHGSPVTDADLAVDVFLRRALPRDEEGWLSEETADDRARLDRHRVWVVDPIDGTREFMEGEPEWCISIGLVEAGVAVAGGIYAPRRGETDGARGRDRARQPVGARQAQRKGDARAWLHGDARRAARVQPRARGRRPRGGDVEPHPSPRGTSRQVLRVPSPPAATRRTGTAVRSRSTSGRRKRPVC